MTKIVDTRGNNFPLISGLPCTDYNADEEFIFQMNKYFHGLMNFEIVSKKGNRNKRIDFLLKGSLLVKHSVIISSMYMFSFFTKVETEEDTMTN